LQVFDTRCELEISIFYNVLRNLFTLIFPLMGIDFKIEVFQKQLSISVGSGIGMFIHGYLNKWKLSIVLSLFHEPVTVMVFDPSIESI